MIALRSFGEYSLRQANGLGRTKTNRLDSLKTPNDQAVSAALLLEKFHTTVFAPRTVSDGPFDLLAWRVSKLARGETPVAPACRQLVKLFALEWSAELPPFLQEIEVQGARKCGIALSFCAADDLTDAGDTTLKSLLVQAVRISLRPRSQVFFHD